MSNSYQPKKDVFILGAGFSKALSTNMPLMIDLGEKLKSKGMQLPKDVPNFYQTKNIEEMLSFLIEDYPWEDEAQVLKKRAAFIDVSKFIYEVIRDSEKEVSSHSPEVQKFFEKVFSNEACLITLNYDTLLERALIDVSKKVTDDLTLGEVYAIPLANSRSRDGSGLLGKYPAKSKVRVLKLHGSVNWYYSGNESYFGEAIFLHDEIGKTKDRHSF